MEKISFDDFINNVREKLYGGVYATYLNQTSLFTDFDSIKKMQDAVGDLYHYIFMNLDNVEKSKYYIE